MPVVLGRGVLNWHPRERRSDRYGTVGLWTAAAGGGALIPWPEFVRSLEGTRGRLVAKVLESRRSFHVGDLFRHISPSQPAVGERIELGIGTFFVEEVRGRDDVSAYVGLMPLDARESDWLDPHKLYRAHDQTVELTFEQLRGRKHREDA